MTDVASANPMGYDEDNGKKKKRSYKKSKAGAGAVLTAKSGGSEWETVVFPKHKETGSDGIEHAYSMSRKAKRTYMRKNADKLVFRRTPFAKAVRETMREQTAAAIENGSLPPGTTAPSIAASALTHAATATQDTMDLIIKEASRITDAQGRQRLSECDIKLTASMLLPRVLGLDYDYTPAPKTKNAKRKRVTRDHDDSDDDNIDKHRSKRRKTVAAH